MEAEWIKTYGKEFFNKLSCYPGYHHIFIEQ